MAPVISAKDLYKCYPGFPPVLRGVDIDVMPGEMVAIMGPSGCGKSTMLHILGMLHAPDSGQLEILGQDALKLDSEQTAAFRRGNMGFVMQASNLFEHSTVFENVEFPLIYENVPPQERWERVIRALDLVRLSSRVHYRSNRLSGGEQQRVAIARAMVNNPRILLADEPTGALDARTSRVIMENFRSLCHDGGVAMVMVTHDPKMAEYCDSIYTLEEGKLRCKKREPPRTSASSAAGFLKPPEPVVCGVLIAWRFPDPRNHAVLELARRMHGKGLLSRIYALTKNGFLAGNAGYSLPLAVRRIGFWQRLLGRLRAFSCGAIMARWALEDKIQFLYAAGARRAAAGAWIAAEQLKLPFAFAIRPEDIPYLGRDCQARARAAAFITCSTKAAVDAFLKLAPDIPPEKVLLLPNPPIFASDSGEPEPGLPPQPGKPADILAMGPKSNPACFAVLMRAAACLKKSGRNIRLSCIGKPGFGLRLRIFFSGLRKCMFFSSAAPSDSHAEQFRGADVFVAWPLAGKGMDLAMPWPLCEAMAFGLPIAAEAVAPGMAPLRQSASCMLAESPEKLADAIKKLLDDKAEAQRLGAAAKKEIRAFLDVQGSTLRLADRIADAAGLAEEQKMAAGDGF